jgi:hypothetical protein
MASRLSPIPGSEPKPLSDVLASSTTRKASIPDSVKRDVAKRKSKEPPAQKFTKDKDDLVTIEEYHALMEDRPMKLGPKTSGFIRGGGKSNNETSCLHCVHFYTSPASAHSTCELVRESDEKDQVMADDTCKLFSKDGKTLPFLKEEETAEEATA